MLNGDRIATSVRRCAVSPTTRAATWQPEERRDPASRVRPLTAPSQGPVQHREPSPLVWPDSSVRLDRASEETGSPCAARPSHSPHHGRSRRHPGQRRAPSRSQGRIIPLVPAHPIPARQRPGFTGLDYYPVDAAYSRREPAGCPHRGRGAPPWRLGWVPPSRGGGQAMIKRIDGLASPPLPPALGTRCP